VKSIRASVLSASDIHAHNTFDRPDTVRPRDGATESGSGSLITHTFPPASVTRLTVELD
jgi:alpha-L-arabinofuranosidase